MSTIKIVLLDQNTLGEHDFTNFEALGTFESYAFTLPEQVKERIQNADVVITNKVKLMKEEINSASHLKLICVAATGVNNVDVEFAQQKGIEVKNVKGYSTQGVAQQTFATILSAVHRLYELNDYVRSGQYSKEHSFTFIDERIYDLEGKTFGIIGLGEIGRRVAEIAKVLGCKVIYYSTSGKNSNTTYAQVDLKTLLSTSDIVSIHAPLNEQTRYLLHAENLKWMKPNAILNNVGRGGIVHENDLVEALLNGVLDFACIDVYEHEPISIDHPFLDERLQHKVLLTPHTAWASKESRVRLMQGVYHNITTWLQTKKTS
jgi:lactate dehydrogenase-like 2-hydroxyacid dehydrogenase